MSSELHSFSFNWTGNYRVQHVIICDAEHVGHEHSHRWSTAGENLTEACRPQDLAILAAAAWL